MPVGRREPSPLVLEHDLSGAAGRCNRFVAELGGACARYGETESPALTTIPPTLVRRRALESVWAGEHQRGLDAISSVGDGEDGAGSLDVDAVRVLIDCRVVAVLKANVPNACASRPRVAFARGDGVRAELIAAPVRVAMRRDHGVADLRRRLIVDDENAGGGFGRAAARVTRGTVGGHGATAAGQCDCCEESEREVFHGDTVKKAAPKSKQDFARPTSRTGQKQRKIRAATPLAHEPGLQPRARRQSLGGRRSQFSISGWSREARMPPLRSRRSTSVRTRMRCVYDVATCQSGADRKRCDAVRVNTLRVP